MTSSDDARFDDLVAAVEAVLDEITRRYEAVTQESGNFPREEFVTAGTYFELIPDNPAASRVQLHPEYTDDVTLYLDDVPFYVVNHASKDLADTTHLLLDIVGGIAEGQVTIQEKRGILGGRSWVVNVDGLSGRSFKGVADVPPFDEPLVAYRRR